MNKEIFESFKSGKTLIFPSEVAARSNLREYVLQSGGVIFKDHSISWDTFKEKFSPIPEGFKQASVVSRLIFTEIFFEKNANKLRYYNNRKFPESSEKFKTMFAKHLPQFKNALDNIGVLPDDQAHDIKLALEQYTAYLQEKHLYEKDYIKPDFSRANPDEYIVVLPGCIQDTDVKDALKTLKAVESAGELPELNLYENTLGELRNTVRKIYGLLKNGEKAEDIAITLTDFDHVYPYLLEEAEKRNIVLDPSKGKKLIDYNAASLFTCFKNLCEKGFEFDTLRSFLLNPDFPFNNIEKNREIIRVLAENNAYGELKDLQDKLGKDEYLEKMASFIKSTVEAESWGKLRERINGFQDLFFIDKSFSSTGNNLDIDVFRKCMDFIDVLEREADSDVNFKEKPFDLFVRVLSNCQYEKNTETSGIKVYNYPVSCALSCKYHFVIGLDDETTSQNRKTVNFFSKAMEEAAGIQSEEMGDSLISSFALSNNPVLSCSNQTFCGSKSVASVFQNSKVKIKKCLPEKDSYSEEENFWLNPEKSSIQSPSFKAGKKQASYFSKSRLIQQIDLRQNNEFPPLNKEINISATSVNTFETCPYKWMCRTVEEIEQDQLDPQPTDQRGIGNVLHKTYEEFFRENRQCSLYSTEEYQKKLAEVLKKNISAYAHSEKAPDRLHVYRLISNYSQTIGKIAKISEKARTKLRLEEYQVFDMERSFDFSGPGYKCSGRIDCILVTPDGNFAVIDFKKKTVDKQSIQLFLYAKALKEKEGKNPKIGSFYSIEDEKFSDIWSDVEQVETAAPAIDERINNVVEMIKDRKFFKHPSKKNCEKCEYSRICRARYVIK